LYGRPLDGAYKLPRQRREGPGGAKPPAIQRSSRRKLMRHTFLIALVAGAMSAAPAMAQSTAQKPSSTTEKPSATTHKPAAKTQAGAEGAITAADRAFVKEAAIGGMAEVEFGNLAKEKASSADVKQFGDRMVTDHGKANDELKAWAQQKNVTLPTELDARHKATHDRLSKLSGDTFDKAYMREMVSDHEKDVAAFKKESSAAHDPDLKAWVTKTLPTLEDHLKMAHETYKKVSGTAGTTGKQPTTPKK
jgi:putative membrane protein